ncbi:hypothetical protein [Streptomyces viridochromogenes]|uniref:hypothetical protein n=1 Tax=Streptomyces viridochromogenes TaxID=1938 RepID=UPI00055DDE33|nr:hypothetical protein [Streptomyces viridochromogenes]
MSRPPEQENGTYGADRANGVRGVNDVHGANRPTGGAGLPPNVYHPQPTAPPAYEGYADPASAHGWQNAYDETVQMPPVADAGPGAADGVADTVAYGGGGGASAADGYGYGDGAGSADGGGAGSAGGYDYSYSYSYGTDDDYGFGEERGRRAGGAGRGSRRKPTAWRRGRVAMVAGAVGAVSVAALIAGFSLSGSSSAGDPQGERDRTSSTAEDSATDFPGDGPAASRSPEPSRTDTPDATGSPSASATPTEDGEDDRPTSTPSTTSAAPSVTSAAPSTANATPSAPTTTASATAPGGDGDDKPGRGQGNAKGPR